MKRTKIVCTMGPSTDSKEILGALVDAGMDVARFNFSHGSYEEHKGRMDLLKEVRAEKKKPIAIMLDTKGPEIRTKLLKGGKKVELVEGQSFTLTTRDVEGTSEIVSQTYDRLPTDLKPGDTVLIDDGLIAMTVQETTDTDVVCRVDNGGMLGERKGINLPNVEIHPRASRRRTSRTSSSGSGRGSTSLQLHLSEVRRISGRSGICSDSITRRMFISSRRWRARRGSGTSTRSSRKQTV